MTIKVTVAPKGMGLNDFVAMREGFFATEGLDVEFDMKTFRGTQGNWKDLDYFNRPQDRPFSENRSVIQGACAWGSICNASAGMGKFVPDCYGVSPWGIFVRPDSKIKKADDLKDIPIAVGMRAGSHFNVPYRLEKYLPLENIKPINVGGFGARLSALLNGEVEAASLLPPQIDMAKQLGMRSVMEDSFHTIWWVPDGMSPDVLRRYLRRSITPRRRCKPTCGSTSRYGNFLFRPNSRTGTGSTTNSPAASASSINRYQNRSSMKS
ncbi:MAG: hypothetical protein WB495_28870 [Xanthobacteraceae bacterium]